MGKSIIIGKASKAKAKARAIVRGINTVIFFRLTRKYLSVFVSTDARIDRR